MGELLEGTCGGAKVTEFSGVQANQRLNEHVIQIEGLRQRLDRLEQQNPLTAFAEDRWDAGTLLGEITRLMRENHQLKEALGDAHRNAEAVVLLTKLAMGEG